MCQLEQREYVGAGKRVHRCGGFRLPQLSPRSRFGCWLVGSLVLFAAALFTNVASAPIYMSEAWYLQVVNRVLTGETLYRDVYFPSLPLSVYITAALAAVFGSEALLVKAIMALFLTLSTLLSYRIARQLGLGRVTALSLAGVGAIYVTSWMPGPGTPYTPMTYTCLMAGFSAILSWRERALQQTGAERGAAARDLVVAGVSAGLSFGTKQNIGAYALVGLCVAVIACRREARMDGAEILKALLLLSSAFCAVVGLVLLPVLLSGGFAKFLDYGFLGLGSYVRLGQISYGAELDELVRVVRDRATWQNPKALYYQLEFLLPFPVFAALLCVWFREGPARRGVATIVLSLAGAAFLGVFPRVDVAHMICSVPPLLLALAWACRQLLPEVDKPWPLLVGMVMLAGVITGARSTYVANPLRRIRSGAVQFSDLPHFRGCLMRTGFLESLRSNARSLTEGTVGETVFILDNSCSLYYLITGIKNPTPFDYPQATSFGVNGEEEVVDAVEEGRISYVCMNPLGADPLAPVLLEDYVQSRMERICNIGFCTLYRSPL